MFQLLDPDVAHLFYMEHLNRQTSFEADLYNQIDAYSKDRNKRTLNAWEVSNQLASLTNDAAWEQLDNASKLVESI